VQGSGDSHIKYLCKRNSINIQNVHENAINNFWYGTMARPDGDILLQLRWTVIRYATNSPEIKVAVPVNTIQLIVCVN